MHLFAPIIGEMELDMQHVVQPVLKVIGLLGLQV